MTGNVRDEELLARLKREMEAADPVPDLVRQASKAVFTWRTVETELLELDFDSAVDELVGVRASTSTVRTLRFTAGGLELEIDLDDGHIDGLVVGDFADDVRLQQPDTSIRSAPVDAMGRFEFDDAPSGPVRFRLGEHVTAWFVL